MAGIECTGMAVTGPKEKFTPFKFTRRGLLEEDVLIDIKWAGICHSDVHQARDEWGGSMFPMVPGHEIAGVVSAIGKGVKNFKVGDQVGVGCLVGSCRKCKACNRGLEQYCSGLVWTYNSKDPLNPGVSTYGGYSNKIVVNQFFVCRLPSHVSIDVAAPLMCAGITMYSPLKHWKAGPGVRVGIVGLGGLGHVGVKLAVAMKAEVTVISHNDKKKADAKRLGATNYINTSEADAFKKNAGSFDLIINTVGVEMDWNAFLGLLDLEGSFIQVGVPSKAIPVHAFSVIAGRKTLSGSLIGGIAETQEMLDFCEANNIGCEVEQITPSEIDNAYTRMLASDVRYRFVIDASKF